MPRVDEKSLRKAGWQPGMEVVLADGQVWHFPRPTLVYRMHVDPETRMPVMRPGVKGLSATYAELLDRLEEQSDGSAAMFSWITAMALELLSPQYTIPDELVPELFAWDPSSDASIQRWVKLKLAVCGRGAYPKPAPVG
jgi:hypothetical protein